MAGWVHLSSRISKLFYLTSNPMYFKPLAINSPGCYTLKDKSKKATNLKTALNKPEFTQVEFITTTADCWTVHWQSFIGVTAHCIESATLQRCCEVKSSDMGQIFHCTDITALPDIPGGNGSLSRALLLQIYDISSRVFAYACTLLVLKTSIHDITYNMQAPWNHYQHAGDSPNFCESWDVCTVRFRSCLPWCFDCVVLSPMIWFRCQLPCDHKSVLLLIQRNWSF